MDRAACLTARPMPSPRRLVFGQVAELYDRSRPSYPAALVDDLLALAPLDEGRRALEVGAGTGIATRLVAARGVPVTAIEPSAEMAAVARRTCAGLTAVEIVESDFEAFDAGRERFGLIYSAQAWHWIDPALAYVRARASLVRGGLLAAFWNRPAWGDSGLRRALADAYRASAPAMASDGPMHPENTRGFEDAGWLAPTSAAAGFAEPEVRRYGWTLQYSADEYVDMLATTSDVRLLAESTRVALLAGVRAVIAGHGGRLEMPMQTGMGLARAV